VISMSLTSNIRWADKDHEEVMTHCSNYKVERSGKTKLLNL